MGTEWLSLDSLLLPVWVGSLLFVLLVAAAVLFFPKVHEKIQTFLFPLLIIPSLGVLLTFTFNGLMYSDRPVVHWIFQKNIPDSLGIGFVLDPMTLIVGLVFSLAFMVTCLRNRPQVHVISALSLSWVALAITASSKTFWTAALGLGIGIIAKILPILFDRSTYQSRSESMDSLWMASSKRAWIGLLVTLAGAAGLVSQGLRLEFFKDGSWSDLLNSPKNIAAAVLFLIGLFIQFLPAITSPILHRKWTGYLEEENFIFETAGGWISVLVIYRILPSLRDTPWALGVEITALFILALSLISLAFLESKRGAISFWLANLPLLVLTILPSLQSQTAFLFVAGSAIAFCGLLLCVDHLRNRVDLALAVFFFLGSFGFIGWSTAAGVTEFFTKIEEQAILGSVVLLVWILFAAFGFRIILRGGESEPRVSNLPRWATAGFFILLGFGPLLSGRWGVGAIPEVSDWLSGATDWPWIKPTVTEVIPMSWLGFGVGQSVTLLGILLGTFVASGAKLFPFATKYPKGLTAARGLFGGIWIHQAMIQALTRTGIFWTERVSDPVWESIIPGAFSFVFKKLRIFAERVEELADLLTSSRFAYFVRSPSKFVQWFHGGNVRLYAWFALGWILIISIYLAR